MKKARVPPGYSRLQEIDWIRQAFGEHSTTLRLFSWASFRRLRRRWPSCLPVEP